MCVYADWPSDSFEPLSLRSSGAPEKDRWLANPYINAGTSSKTSSRLAFLPMSSEPRAQTANPHERAMQPTEILSQEHRVILQVLACLERIIDIGVRARHVDRRSAEQALEFLRTFADRCHHRKEEDALFPKLLEAGLPEDRGPVAVMRGEHEEARNHLRAMTANLEEAALGDGLALDAFVKHSKSYIALLREHIAKEDQILFPMAEVFLDVEARRELPQAFGEAEQVHGEGIHARMLKVAEDLGERYGVGELASAEAQT